MGPNAARHRSPVGQRRIRAASLGSWQSARKCGSRPRRMCASGAARTTSRACSSGSPTWRPAVEGRYTAPAHTCGAPGVIHGGIQAVLLDEAIGFAIHAHHESVEGRELAERVGVVTAEFDLRYRRPAATGVELVLRGEVVHVRDRDYLAVAEIRDGTGTELLTSATARWRRVQ